MNIEEFDELIKLRNRIREEIYIKIVSNLDNNLEHKHIFIIAHEAAVAYISNAIYLTDEDIDDIRKYVGVNY